MRIYWKQVLKLLFLLVTFLVIFIWKNSPKKTWQLKDISDNPVPSRSGKNIFFHVTNPIENGILTLHSRQACAIESAARANVNHSIFVTFSSNVGFRNTSLLPLIDAVLLYPNVQINLLDFDRYLKNTPIENVITKEKVSSSSFKILLESNILRLTSLWKYGGTYIDLGMNSITLTL